MQLLQILFWVSLAVVFYTYIGYGLLIWPWAKFKNKNKKALSANFEPEVTIVVPAYNEADILEEKVLNCLGMDYPKDKLKVIFITDGSNDHSGEILKKFPEVMHLHISERGGKSLAENRAITFVKTPYVVFTDANTTLNPEAVREIVKHYQDDLVGAVSGEKKLFKDGTASGEGEGLYWKYESFLKKCDSDIYSLMGAAGELVSFRTALFAPLEKDTILDDFVQSLRIVKAGYKVVYEPKAYAMEAPSASLKEEMKRKVRICAGAWQSMVRLKSLLNPFHQPLVTFLYVSHRVLRWSLTPLLLVLLLPLNLVLSVKLGGIYTVFLFMQIGFYLLTGLGWWLAQKGTKSTALLVPLYFSMMNLAVFQGFIRYIKKSQPAAWEKARRMPA